MSIVGTKDYGTYKDGSSSVYKDSRGFYIVEYNLKTAQEYKKYIKGWKQTTPMLCLTKRRWRPCKKGTRRTKNRHHK
jgi:hypothetical protein